MNLESLFTLNRSIDTSMPVQEAMDRVQQAIGNNRNLRCTPVRTADNSLSFSVGSKHYTRVTSFCPEATVKFDASVMGTTIRTTCRSKEQIRIMLPAVTVLFLILEIYNLILSLNGNAPGIAAFLIPIFLIFLLGSLTYLGLHFPAKEIDRTIHNAFSQNSGS